MSHGGVGIQPQSYSVNRYLRIVGRMKPLHFRLGVKDVRDDINGKSEIMNNVWIVIRPGFGAEEMEIAVKNEASFRYFGQVEDVYCTALQVGYIRSCCSSSIVVDLMSL
jgi:hypothetical protein